MYTRAELAASALITIDTQRDTLDGRPLEIPGTTAVLPAMRKLLDAWRRERLPVIHVVRIYKRDGSNVDLCRRDAVEAGKAILLEGSEGCELAGELFQPDEVALETDVLLSGKVQAIGDHEVIMHKPRWGAFYATPLESHLRALGVNTLVFAGCNYPNCPRASVYEASERDFRIVLVEDAVSGLYPRGREEMLEIGVNVLDSDAVVAALAVSATGAK